VPNLYVFGTGPAVADAPRLVAAVHRAELLDRRAPPSRCTPMSRAPPMNIHGTAAGRSAHPAESHHDRSRLR
jgi:hypothetical protein